MAYKQTYNQGSLFMNYMNAKTYLESHRDDRVPPFALAPHSSKYITEGIRTQEKSRCIILVTSESVLFVQLRPVNYSDGSGHMAVALALLVLGGIGAVAGFSSQSISDSVTGKGFDWGRSGIAAEAGFLGGLCYAVPVVGGVLGSAVSSGLNTVGQMAISGKQYSVGEYVGRGLLSAAVGGLTSFAFGQLTSGIGYFADTDFFMSNFVKFATDYGGITLKNSAMAQFSAQLAVKYTVVGLAESAFDLILGYFNNRVKGYGIQEAWRYALADW